MTTSPEPNTERQNARLDFVRRHLGSDFTIEPASEDASFRSYFRVATSTDGTRSTRIVMDAPPATEPIAPWLDIGARLHAAGLHTPDVFASDIERGFVLMEDLGVRTYLPELDERSVDTLYGDALDALLRMQTRADVAGLAPYDDAFLVRELELFPEWFLRRHLGFEPSCDEWDVIEAAFRLLANSALAQPRTFVHRDFHSRNLLVTDAHSPGVIDFQGALIGPITYDLASLLRDCYIAWDIERVDGWVEAYRQRLRHAHVLGVETDGAHFRRWFDWMGLQRHLKVLGIFCRLWYRDGKRGYLDDLPRVVRYVTSVAAHYSELADFVRLIERAVGDRDVSRTSDAANAAT